MSTSVASPFSVQEDDPFIIFRKLREIAKKAVGEEEIIDLSRGDPGYGFTPSSRGRAFSGFVLLIDSAMNADPDHRFADASKLEIWNKIEKYAYAAFQKSTGDRLISMLKEFVGWVANAALEEGKHWQEHDILRGLFNHCAMSGGLYLDPKGQVLTRIVVAKWHRNELSVNITSDDLILTSGASHAIGAVFKALGEEGCGYLKPGDGIAIASPAYSPYNRIIEERALKTIPFSVNRATGDIENVNFGGCAKTLVLIDPNNPTGISLSQNAICALANEAREKNMLVITDEVYCSFFKKKQTMLALCPERTICINARSKIERSTGIRFGEIITMPEGRKNMPKIINVGNETEFEKLLIFAKAPGRTGGQFQHTTFVPGPSQLLGMAHIVLGAEERSAYMQAVAENRDIFCKELNLNDTNSNYYIIFDLNAICGSKTRNMTAEEKLILLAKKGIIFIPVYRFFAATDRKKAGILTSVRASIVNTTPDRILEAAKRTREVLC